MKASILNILLVFSLLFSTFTLAADVNVNKASAEEIAKLEADGTV